MALRRSSYKAGRGALLILASTFGLVSLVAPAFAQDVIATPPQLVRQEPAAQAVAPAAADPNAALAPRPQFDTRGWKCTAHADCVLVRNNCGTVFDVVNKAFIDNWQAFNRDDTADCRPLFAPGEWEAAHTPVCLNNTCGMVQHKPGDPPITLPPVKPVIQPAQ